MKEYQARSTDMKSIMCQWPEWDRNSAIETYRREWQNAPETDLRHGKVLVLAEWESPDEADRARLDWLDNWGYERELPKSWSVELPGDQTGNTRNVRVAIDAARKAPEEKITVIEMPTVGRAVELETNMKCEICNQGPPTGPAIYRVNKPGEMPARWRCKAHLTDEQSAAIDPEVKDITETIESSAPNNDSTQTR